MPPDIDWGQVIFLALVVIVGFVRWVGNLIAQQKEAKARANLSPEEIALRDAAWRKQVGMDEEPESPSPPPADPFRELKDLFEQLREPTPAPAPPPLRRPPPPPLPVHRHVAAAAAPAPPPLKPVGVSEKVFVPTPTQAFPTSHHVHRQFTEAVAHRDRPVSAKLTNLRRELATPKALRQAILIREVLGPPKALRTD
jgi:hypothetical protein